MIVKPDGLSIVAKFPVSQTDVKKRHPLAAAITDRPMKHVNLSVEEWRVVSFINPKNTMKQIAQTNKMSELEVRRIVYGLLQAGLVEMVRPEGAVVAQNPKTYPTQDKEEQKTLINKLIGRIRTM